MFEATTICRLSNLNSIKFNNTVFIKVIVDNLHSAEVSQAH